MHYNARYLLWGSQSAAERMLRKKLKARGVDEDTINDYMKISSENQIRDDLKHFVEEDVLKSNEQKSEIEKKQAEVTEKAYNLLLKGGVNKNVAWANSKLFGVFYKNFGAKDNAAFDKWFNKLDVRYNITPEELHNQLKQEAFYQSAMYKSPLENFQDFYNQVFEKENEAKENKTKVQKSFYEYKNDNVYLRVKHDAINHVEKGHQLTPDEWKNVLDNITNIENAEISSETYSNDKVALMRINTPKGKYGVAIQFANGKNYIATAFKSTDKGIDTWIKKGSAKMLSNNPIAPLEDNKSSVSDVILGQNPTDIIAYIKQQLNPSEQNSNVLYQSASSAGVENTSDIEDAKKEWKEKGTDSKYFKKWFGGSKVVDENSKPLIAYHNTNNDFEVFSREFEGQANGRPVYGGGFNFTTNKTFASGFGTKQMACYLSIKNPLNEKTYKPENFIEPVYKLFYGENYKNYMKGSDNWTGYLEDKLSTLYGLRDLMQGLQYKKGIDVIEFYKSLGYDGIQDGHIWVAFETNQIKSVDNQGTFDETNPNIFYQSGGNEDNQNVVDLTDEFDKVPKE